VITGAAGGIGREMISTFAGYGAQIGAIDHNGAVHDIGRSLAGSVQLKSAVADISNSESVEAAFAEICGSLGAIDVLINNAGYSGASNLETTDASIWRKDIDVNLNGTYHCTSIAIREMKRQGSGSIVNIGSVNGTTALGDPAYSAGKAGMISYTKSVAMEYGRFGIRANMVNPGTVRTPIWDHRIKKNPQIFEDLVKWYPLRRICDPIDIANAAAFLASDLAAAISGAVLPVDCGLTAGNVLMSRDLTMLEF
jgi:NAD(P)-dependent dehydrogenase (short-subunit alcohol dehydrogenase family)